MSSLIISEKFESFFKSQYGERWAALREALVRPERQIFRRNLFVQTQVMQTNDLQSCEFIANSFWRPENRVLIKNEMGLYEYYVMDPASVLVALALEVQPEDEVLDLCAAPGGKTLVLAEQLDGGSLISNEMSESRRSRLMRVLHEYIPHDRRQNISVKGLDGNQYGLRMPEAFDRVLADVPCSGERHLLENHKELELWSEKRSRNLAVRQISLLSSAWLSCRSEGRIVYSTCSISPLENDAVVAKLVKKRGAQILRPARFEELDFLEKTEFGYGILPDRSGFGPMYFAVIQKA